MIAELAQRSPDLSLAWDSGTGSGQAAVQLATHFDNVYATEPSQQQIDNAQPHPNVKYAVERAENPSLSDDSVSLAVAAQALHWYDLPRYFNEVRRVLKPGGLLAVFGYDWFFINEKIDAVVEKAILAPLRPHWAENNQLLWDGYRTIKFPDDFPEHELALPPFAIHLRWSLEDLLAYVQTWSAARKFIDVGNPNFFSQVRAQLAEVWGTPECQLDVVMPIHIRVAKLS